MNELIAYLLPEDQQGAMDWRYKSMLNSLDLIKNSVRIKVQGVDFAKVEVEHEVPFVTLNGKKKSFENLWNEVIGEKERDKEL